MVKDEGTTMLTQGKMAEFQFVLHDVHRQLCKEAIVDTVSGFQQSVTQNVFPTFSLLGKIK